MDAITRVTFYFPAQSLASFWLISNLVINNQLQCANETQILLSAVIGIFCVFVVLSSFIDTYTASNNMKFIVLLVPVYGPVCFSLPTDFDKDRVFDHFHLKVRDYVRAFTSMTAFLLVVLFINPVAPCLFPSSTVPGASRLDPAIIRTVPVVAAIVTALLMMCLGTPRQSLGFQNVDETCPPLEKQMGENPIYAASKESEHHQGSQMDYPQATLACQERDYDPVYSPPSPSSKQAAKDVPYAIGTSIGRPGTYMTDQYSPDAGRSSKGLPHPL